MPAQGWSVAIPWEMPLTNLQTLKALATTPQPVSPTLSAFGVRLFFCYPGYRPWAKIRELLRSSTGSSELICELLRTLTGSSDLICELLRSSTGSSDLICQLLRSSTRSSDTIEGET